MSLSRYLTLAMLSFLTIGSIHAGSWQYFPYADQYRRVQVSGDDILMLKGNRLILANGKTWQFVREYDRMDGLSGFDITDIAYSEKAHKLAIVYSDGIIDLLHQDGSLSTLSDLHDTPMEGQSKHINSIYEGGDGQLFISTRYGFLIVDMEQEIIRYSINIGQSVKKAWKTDSHYYYMLQSGQSFKCPVRGNLFHPNSWTSSSATPPSHSIPSGAVDQCRSVTGDTIYTLFPDEGLTSTAQEGALQVTEYQHGSSNNRLFFQDGILATCHVSDLTFYDYLTNMNAQGYLSEYDPTASEWSFMGHRTVTDHLAERQTFGGIMDMTPDPSVPHRYYYSSLENGIYVIQDGALEVRWDNFNQSGHIEPFTGNSSRVGGLAISPKGDLWYINEGVDKILRVHTHDGKWYKYTVSGADGQVSMPHLIHSKKNNMLWGCRTTGHQKCVIFAYDHAGTLSRTNDDRSVTFLKLIDQYGTEILPFYIKNIIEGPDGAIWILSTSGIHVIDHPEEVFDHPGAVRTVISSLEANTMLFDTEGNLWIGTTGKGILLYDPSGNGQLQQFTTDNCMLTSNEILALAFDHTSHTLWASCIGSILSYQYDAGEYRPAMTNTAYCYPASLPAGSIHPVNVVGMADGSLVTVTDSEQQTVFSTTAIGGTASINVEDFAPGNYHIQGTNSEGEAGISLLFTIEK